MSGVGVAGIAVVCIAYFSMLVLASRSRVDDTPVLLLAVFGSIPVIAAADAISGGVLTR